MTSALTAPRVVGVGLKMYLDHFATARWLESVRQIARDHPSVTSGEVALFVLPTFPSLVGARDILAETKVYIGAQDIAWADAGPFTGEVSGVELRQVGCTFVEIGHGERRRHLGEDDSVVARKLDAAFRNGLTPVLCVGEDERVSASVAGTHCVDQLEAALALCLKTGSAAPLIVAYEPNWAIGAPQPAPAEYIREVASHLRVAMNSHPLLDGSRLIYGGSAGAGLLPSLGASVDGLFLGRSTHDTSVLRQVIDEAAAAHSR
jgi:triosephosphate isomerase